MKFGRNLRRTASRALVCTFLAAPLVGCGPTPDSAFPSLRPPPSLPEAPAAAKRLKVELPPSIRHFAVSNNKQRVAFMEDVTTSKVSALLVGEIENRNLQLAVEGRDIERLQWAAGDNALVFGTREDRVIPGQFSDWDIPASETIAYRIMRLRLPGGAPEVLLGSKYPIEFSLAKQAEKLVFTTATESQQNAGDNLTSYDLATGAKAVLWQGPVTQGFSLAPDGNTVAFVSNGPTASQEGQLRLLSIPTQKSLTIPTARLQEVGWIDSQRLLVSEYGIDDPQQLRLRTVSTEGKALSDVVVEGNGIDYAPYIGGDGAGISPDGKWVLTASKGEGSAVISLETGRVYRSPYFGWRGWLDADYLIGTFQTGLYKMPMAMVFDLTTSGAIVGPGKKGAGAAPGAEGAK